MVILLSLQSCAPHLNLEQFIFTICMNFFSCDPYLIKQARLCEELNNARDPNNKNTHNDILAKVLCGMNKPSSLRHYGLLPVDPPKARKLDRAKPTGKDKANIIAEARRLADEETKPLREKMEEMEKRHEEMVEEMNRMRSTMKAVHQLVLARDDLRAVLSGFFGGLAGED